MDRYLIWSLVKPSHLLVLMGLIGIVLRRRPAGQTLLVAVVAALIAAAVLPLGALLMVPLEQRFTRPDAQVRPDGIIVLAGAESAALSTDYGDAQLTGSADRLTTFITLAHRFPAARLVHSGSGAGNDPGDLSQSEVARALILGVGVDPERVVFEDRSTNTCNAPAAVAAYVPAAADEQWWLVTSAFHMPRAVACFRAAGWAILAYPTDYRYTKSRGFWPPDMTTNLRNIDLAAHEWLGLAYYRVSGMTDALFPADAGP